MILLLAALAHAAPDPMDEARRLLAEGRPADAAALCRALAEAEPTRADAHGCLVVALVTLGDLPAALAAAHTWLQRAPHDVDAVAWTARLTSWTPGGLDEATARYDAGLAEFPRSAELHLGRAQVARWAGDRRAARDHLEWAERLAPDDARVRAERARLELDAGRVGSAGEAAASAERLSPGLYEAKEARLAVATVRAPTVTLRATTSDESTGFSRLTLAVPAAFRPLPDSRIEVTPAWTRFGAETQRFSGGLSLTQGGLPQALYGRVEYRLLAQPGAEVRHAGGLEVGSTGPLDLPATVRLGVRERALVDAPADAQAVAPLQNVGSAGATVEGIGLHVREAWVGLAAAPLPGGYVYADAAFGRVDGDNARRTLAAGLGLDVLARGGGRHGLTPKLDAWSLHVDAPDVRYFSPETFLVWTPGLEWTWRATDGVTVGAEAGAPLQAGPQVGWLAGAWGQVALGERFTVEARARGMDDTVYRAVGGTFGVGGRF